MPTLSRPVVSIVAIVVVSAALALPASAGQLIEYRGETSAPSPNRVVAWVLKRDSGRRFLRFIAVRSTLTCEDASTQQFNVVIGIGRLGKGGSFAREINDRDFRWYLRVDGTIGFRSGSGTALFNKADLTQDGTDAQLCTTGEQTWTVDRTNAQPVKPSAVDIPGGKGYLKVRTLGGAH
jgi:hypothetical protein